MTSEINTYEDLQKYFMDNEFINIIYSEYGCKIGISKNPTQRLEQIRLGLPSQKANFIGLYKGKNSAYFEKQLHVRLKKRKISGEWFILSQTTLDDIDTYLLGNNFFRIIKTSILWANYLFPSIYLKGHIRIIEIEKESKTQVHKKSFPQSLNGIILKPTMEEIAEGSCEFLTTTEICIRIEKFDFNFTPMEIGQYLSSRNFKKKSKRIKDVGVRKIYEVIIKD